MRSHLIDNKKFIVIETGDKHLEIDTINSLSVLSPFSSDEQLETEQERWFEILDRLAGDDDECVRANVASNPTTPVSILRRLAEEKNSTIDDSLLIHRNLPDELVDKIVNRATVSCLKGVAKLSFNTRVLVTLATQSEYRWRVASNKNAPADTLRHITSIFIKTGILNPSTIEVAGNPSTPLDVIEQVLEKYLTTLKLGEVSSNTDDELLTRMVSNRALPGQMIRDIYNNNDIKGFMTEKFGLGYIEFYKQMALNPSTPQDILNKLFDFAPKNKNYQDYAIQVALARNPSTPTELMSKLMNIGDYNVWDGLAGNRSAPGELLMTLNRLGGDLVVKALKNPSMPVQQLIVFGEADQNILTYRVYSVALNPATPANILMKLSRSEKDTIRSAVAANPSTPVEILAELTLEGNNEGNYGVLKAVAANRSTPISTLEMLSRNEYVGVVLAVASNDRDIAAWWQRKDEDKERQEEGYSD